MNLETWIELQNLGWKRLKLTVPELERLLKDDTENVSSDLPKTPTEAAAFLDGTFNTYGLPDSAVGLLLLSLSNFSTVVKLLPVTKIRKQFVSEVL
jgi:hypothetical protein